MLNKAAFYILAVFVGSAAAVVGSSLYQPPLPQDGEVFYFYSDYCHYCQQLKPYISDLMEKREIKLCNVASMDEECSSLASSLGIKYVPTMVVRADRDYTFVGFNEVMKAINQLGGVE
ncbi:MAG: Thioredoxin (Trx-1) [Archaeoglobus fulgidus]|uniref:Thioredoxin (Trx-1) n=1 Tax=Archaeoglobus fulgidus TaxID=2234 RepID=A0A101E2F7_ARCFL|nr:thioredoxin family protein [Archaeoglobus fulgidus]KUJ94299.1 MAG: Thioredoxin (Trx-1) [Archaeoglobus fulgidus]KUK07574.1 MAG: Thioredoxin (Trx-1) [Archaeoglobus fulgidus]